MEETLIENVPLQKGEMVFLADGKTGIVTRAYILEDKYAVKDLADDVREIRGANGAFIYFQRRNLTRAGAAPAATPAIQVSSIETSATTAIVEPEAVASSVQVDAVGPSRPEGKVKWFLRDKGFGKITPTPLKGQAQQEDVFMHKKQMRGGPDGPHARLVAEGTRVTFELTTGSDGKPCACDVQVEGLEKTLASLDQAPVGYASKEDFTRHLLLNGLRIGGFQEKGAGKPTMEDRMVSRPGITVESLGPSCQKAVCSFFGVFDGHSGASCSEFLNTHLERSIFECLRPQNQSRSRSLSSELIMRNGLTAAFRTTEHNYFQYVNKLEGGAATNWVTAGSTACTAMLFGPDEEGCLKLAVANAGDSRAVLGRRDGSAIRLSEDHTPDVPSERKRIETAGAAIVQCHGIWRIVLKTNKINAGLSVSRGFGDLDYKQPDGVVSAVPDIYFRSVSLREDCFIVLGSDGIWGPVSDAEAVRIVSSALREPVEDPAKLAAQRLVEAAHARDPHDDKTALVVWFGEIPAPPPAMVATPARLQPIQIASRAVGDDMFGGPFAAQLAAEASRPGELQRDSSAAVAELQDLFASYATEIAQGQPALDAALKRRKIG